jgi:hypothetical protein
LIPPKPMIETISPVLPNLLFNILIPATYY